MPLADVRDDIPGIQRFQYAFAFGVTDDLRRTNTISPASPVYTTIAPGPLATTVKRVQGVAEVGIALTDVAEPVSLLLLLDR